MREATVTINGKAHVVREKRARDNVAWREEFHQRLGEVLDLAQALPDATLESGADLVRVVQQAAARLLPAIGEVWALCCLYDEAFEDAYESEAMAAFPEVVSLAFPLEALVGAAQRKWGGLAALATSSNSPEPNGDSGTTS